MFFGRKRELDILNHLYQTDQFELVIVTGRRRIGKSTLLSKFTEDKPTIFFNAVEGNETLNLELLSRVVSEFKNSDENMIFPSYLEALESIFKLSLTEHFIFVIDEYPFLASAYRPITSLLQMLIDKYKDKSKMMLILSGSSISFMENELIGYKSPLFGRKTAQIKLEPLSFRESLPYFSERTNQEKVLFYGIYGGTPYYLNQIKEDLDLENNLKNTLLSPSSFLSEEPQNLLKQEVSDIASYYSVLTAIARGATKLSEITTKVNLDSSATAKITKNLIELGLVTKEIPYKENRTKKTLYKLNDNIFKFWFKFIPANQSLITRGLSDRAYKKIKPFLNEYTGPIFEDLAKEYLWTLLGRDQSPVDFSSLGRWWGTDPKTRKQIEIDIVAEDDGNTALFAECKWTNEKVRSKVLKDLIAKSQIFPHLIKHYYIFSKTGFTSDLVELARQVPNVYLVSLDQMIETFE